MRKNEYATVFYKNNYYFEIDDFKFNLIKTNKYHHIIHENKILCTILDNDTYLINKKISKFDYFMIDHYLEKIDDKLFKQNNIYENFKNYIDIKITNLLINRQD